MAELPLIYAIDVGGTRHACRRVQAVESLSETSRWEVSFRIDRHLGLDPDALAGEEATIVLSRGGRELRRQAGVLTDVVREASSEDADATSDVTVVLEPRLALLRHRVDIRVFRDRTAPEIVVAVLGQLGVVTVPKLRRSYEARPYCVQWRESDLHFAQRLLEDEGIGYAVDDGDRVILFDDPSAWSPDLGPIPFRHAAGLDQHDEVITEVGERVRATAGRVSLRDFHFEHPSLDMDVGAGGPTAGGPEWYDYPGEYTVPSAGAAKARLRAGALESAATTLAGRTSVAALRPLSAFTLEGAPPGVASRRYAVTRVEHDWAPGASVGALSFRATPDDRAFVPPLATPVPTLCAPLTGFVTGPPGADIHTDAWGRVKVHFPWDRLQPKDDTCSDWIPTLQDNTGESCAIPRTGWEVLCHFLEGDPDRPVILGRVFNGEDVFWEKLPEMKTRTALRSLSSPRMEEDSPAANFIVFEDLAGREEISIQAQRDQVVVVANDKTRQVDVDDTVLVQGHETAAIGADEIYTVVGSFETKVEGNSTVTIGGSRTVEVGDAQSESIQGDHRLVIGGAHARKIGMDDRVSVNASLKETIPALLLEGSVKTNHVTAGRTSALLVGGAIVEIARLGKAENTKKLKLELVGGLLLQQAKEKMLSKTMKSRTLVVGGLLDVTAGKGLLVTGKEKVTVKATRAAFEGDKLELLVGETRLRMQDGTIELRADERISITTSEDNNQTSSTSTQR